MMPVGTTYNHIVPTTLPTSADSYQLFWVHAYLRALEAHRILGTILEQAHSPATLFK